MGTSLLLFVVPATGNDEILPQPVVVCSLSNCICVFVLIFRSICPIEGLLLLMPIMEPARPFKALTVAEPPDVTNAFNPFLMPLTVAPLILFPILFQKNLS